MATFSEATFELHRAGVTLNQVAQALDVTPQFVSLVLRGERNLSPNFAPVLRALAGPDVADRVMATIPERVR